MPDDRLTRITLLVLDVDGVLTDGSIHIDDDGRESKRFHVRDGTGIRIWQLMGYHVAIITGRRGMAIQHRARELGIEHVRQGVANKLSAFNELLQQLHLKAENAAVLADDVPELPLLRAGGYAMAVADAVAEVKNEARFVTKNPGGHAAVREAIEHLLNARGQWPEAVQRFLKREK